MPYGGPPPLEQHPAHFAPYAGEINNNPQPQQQPRSQTPHSAHQPVPNSPGPIPVKMDPDVHEPPRQNYIVPIEPDANPLQTSRSPRSPPAAAVGTFRKLGPGGTALDDIYANHLPGQITHPNQEIKGGTWSHGLCDCTDIGTCCLGIWCPCILYGKTQYRLAMKSRRDDPTNLLGYEKCNASCAVMALLCGCQCAGSQLNDLLLDAYANTVFQGCSLPSSTRGQGKYTISRAILHPTASEPHAAPAAP